MGAEDVVEEIKKNRNASCAAHHQRFFKTGPGEYGEGDLFHGLRVPLVRQIAKKFRQTPLEEIKKLLEDPYHECRMAALFILIDYFSRSREDEKAAAVELYLGSTDFINNWDLVDLSCYKLLGPWLKKRDRAVLYRLSESDSLWEQRISIITTMHFIRCGDFIEALAISEKLLNHPHDLIHKAVGWMLREVGNRDKAAEDGFLRRHYRQMPRTMLRYAIEKYPEAERQAYLKGRI